MKYPCLYILLFFFSSNTCAQTWNWARSTQCGALNGGSEGWLAKTDPTGNVYIAGYFYGDSICFGDSTFYNLYNSNNNIQTIVVKYDSAGRVLWSKASSNGQSRPISITTDKWGNLLVFGFFTSKAISFGTVSLTNTNYDSIRPYSDTCFFILKYNASGNLVWARNGVTNANPDGDYLHPGGIATDGAGNIYIASTYTRPMLVVGNDTLYNYGGTSSTNDIFLARYDSSGNVVWAKTFGGLMDDYVTDLAISSDNRLYITGYYRSGFIAFGSTTLYSQDENAFVVCLDINGKVNWAQSSDNTGSARSIVTDRYNNIYIAGGFQSQISFAGKELTATNGGFYMYKFNESGSVIRATGLYPTASIPSCCQTFGLAVDRCNNVWLSGTADKIVGISLNTTTTIHAPAGSTDPMFIAGYSDSGSLVGYVTLPSGAGYSANLANTGLSADNTGSIYLCGDFRVQNPFVIGADSMYLHNAEASAIFVAKYTPKFTCDTTIIPQYPDVPVITIFPNPASYDCILNYYGNVGVGAMVAIKDMTGKQICSYPVNGVQTHLPLNALPDGVYMCVVKVAGRANYSIKLVVLK